MKINNLYSPSAVFITQMLVELSKQLKQIIQIEHTPNANMADHSVSARDELHESEASEALMFCFDNASQKSLALSSIWSVLFSCGYELLCF